jgi:hypothetical protein
VHLLHCLSLSSCLLESTLPPAAQMLLSQCRQGDLVGHYLRLSNFLERISGPSCEPLYAINTSHLNQEWFFMNILRNEFFAHKKKRTRERSSSIVHFSSMVGILTTETSLRSCACASAT